MNIKLLWQQIPSTIISEILASSTLDGVVLDLEHAVYNPETIYSCIQIIKLKNKLAFVRVPPYQPTLIRYTLDTGCDGVILSTIEDSKIAKELLRITRFTPDAGIRGLGLVRDNLWGKKGLPLRKPITAAQIETKRGIEALKNNEFFDADFDYYMIGPYDLSLSLGCPGDFQNPSFIEAIKSFENTVPIEKRGFHIVKNYQSHIDTYKNYGLLAIGLDTLMIQKYIDKAGNL